MPFDFGGAAVAQGVMATVLVVPAGDEFKDAQLRLPTCRPDVAVDELGLERGKEAFGHGVIPARTWSPDALAHLMSREQLAVRGAGVLNATIGVLNQARFWT